MEKLNIAGGDPLNGTVHISGAKNSAVALIPATILANSEVTIEGLPEISDIETLRDLLKEIGGNVPAMFGSSLALCVSDIPFEGPIAGVTVGRIDGKFVINPTVDQLEKSDINLIVAGTKDAINMVEAGADEVPEEIMLEAIMFGHEEIKRLIAFQEEIVAAVGKEKTEIELYEIDEELSEKVKSLAEPDLLSAIQVHEKHAREDAINEVKNAVVAKFEEEEHDEDTIKKVKQTLSKLVKNEVRRLITEEKVRPDGRGVDQIRPLSSEVGLLPRTHGSGLFTRGQTQALSVCTLGALGDVQILDGLGKPDPYRKIIM